MDDARVAGGGGVDPGFAEAGGVGLALVAKEVVVGPDDQGRGQPADEGRPQR